MTEKVKHPDPDRHWNRKWQAATNLAKIGVAVLFIDLFAAAIASVDVADNVHRVTVFAVPSLFVFMLAYFGISEWNNQTQMKMERKHGTNREEEDKLE